MTSPRGGSADAGAGSFVAILDALAFAAGRIDTLGPWQREVQELLARLGRAASVSRVTLFEVHEDAEGRPVESCRFDWAASGLVPLSGDPRYRNMPIWDPGGAGLEDWSRRRAEGEILQVRLSETSGFDREVFEAQGTLSFLSVPIFVEGRYWGFLGFDDSRSERAWGPLETKVLEIAAALIGGAVARALAQRELRLSQQRHALAALGADDGLWEWDPAEAWAFLSRRGQRILGLAAEGESVGFALLAERLRPAGGGDLAGFFDACFAARRRSFEVECRLACGPDSATGAAPARWVVLRGVILYAVGRPQRLVGSLRDITERKRTQLELERKEHLLRAVVDSVPALINVKDRQSRYLLMNRYQGEVYGIAPERAIGLTSSDIVGPAYGERSRALDLEVLASGRPQPFAERDFVDAEGRPRTWYTAKMPLRDDAAAAASGASEGAVEGVITVALDVSALKAEQRARAQLTRFVAPALVDLVAASDEPFGPPRQQTAAVLFADLVGFTGLAEHWPPHVVFALLREFHDHGARAVFDTGGTLTKFTGDGFMATFGLPSASPHDARNALACARALAAAVESFNAWREVARLPIAKVAIGAHVGPLLIGALGSDERTEIAVIGDTVNVASRLESLVRATGGTIAISEALAEAVVAEAGETLGARLLEGFEPLPPQRLRGRSGAVGVRVFPPASAPAVAVEPPCDAVEEAGTAVRHPRP